MAWKKFTAKSRFPITELLNPKQGTQSFAPRGLTIRKLVGHRRYSRLRIRFTIARLATPGGGLVSIKNLQSQGYDFAGGF